MKNERTQDEWYRLALEAAETIHERQQQLFDSLTEAVYYCVEVSRFDNFVKIHASAAPTDYNRINAKAQLVAEYLNPVCEKIYLNEYTTDSDFDEFTPATIRKMESYAAAVRSIIND